MKKTPARFSSRPLERQRQWTRDGLPVLDMTLSLPGCSAVLPDRRLRRISRCYEHYARCYETYCERFLLPRAAEAFHTAAQQNRPFAPWHAAVHHRVSLLTPCAVSLVLETEERCGSELFRRRRGDTWDLRDGYPLALSDFFPGDSLPLRRLRKAARAELAALQKQGAALRNDWKMRLRTTAGREHFYLTEQGLVFFYPMYALGDASLGIPAFLLPWDETGGPVPPSGHSLPGALDKRESPVLS